MKARPVEIDPGPPPTMATRLPGRHVEVDIVRKLELKGKIIVLEDTNRVKRIRAGGIDYL
jgi:hypothetical protein